MPIRPFVFSDAARPEVAPAAEDLRHLDETRARGEVLGWWLVEAGEQTVRRVEYKHPRNPNPVGIPG